MLIRATCAALGLCLAVGAAQPIQAQSADSNVTVSRLVALGKLWAAIERFHPALGRRSDVDWDGSLVEAISRVRSARTPAEYSLAVDSMLKVLGDPVTRVLNSVDQTQATPPVARKSPSFELTAERTAFITTGDRTEQLEYLQALQKTMSSAVAELQRAQAVVFDLRSTTAPLLTRGWVSFALGSSGLVNALTPTGFVTPSEQTRTSGSFQVADGRRVPPGSDVASRPIVFLVNSDSDVPAEALSLQAMGQAAIVAQGPVNDVSLVTTTVIPLTEGLAARVRLGELVFDDGVHAFQPDVLLPAGSPVAGSDPAKVEAERLARHFDVRPRVSKSTPARGVEREPRTRDDNPFPPIEARLLAIFRLWATIEYAYPYRALMNEDWDALLERYVARAEEARDALAYHLAIAEMVTHIHDSHGVVQSTVLGEYFGTAAPPVRVRLIEGLPVITGFRDAVAATNAGVELGDVILRVDGEPVQERIARYKKYVAASTEQALMRDTLDRRSLVAATGGILFGRPDSTVTLSVRTARGAAKEIRLPRTLAFSQVTAQRSGPVTRILDGNIGYVDLDRLTAPMVENVFRQLGGTTAIIFDMRGYPKAAQQTIAGHLVKQEATPAALFERRIPVPPGTGADNIRNLSKIERSLQLFGPTSATPYLGRTVMLIDERTQSAAEHLGLFLQAANGTKFVGSPSAGANGNAGPVALPGGIRFSLSWLGVAHADGRQLQRMGLVPDIEVKPTVKGIQDGRDEVLDAAVRYLRQQLQ